jgi:tape measure domain-containing protein
MAADFEQTSVAFKVMLGDAQLARKVLGDLQQFAASTPFQLEGIQQTARVLLAFGVQSQDLMGTMRMLGDVSAGTGKDFTELAVIFGQIKAAGRLMGGDLLQLVNAGVPMIAQLAKHFGVAESEIKKMVEQGKVGFDDVLAAFRNMTSEGGLFFNMMSEQSQTLNGVWSTLKDNVAQLALELGTKLLPLLKAGAEIAIALTEGLRAVDGSMVANIARVAAFVATFALALTLIPKIIAGIRTLIVTVKALTTANAIATAFTPGGLIRLAIASAAAGAAVLGVNAMFSQFDQQVADAGGTAANVAAQVKELADNTGELATQASVAKQSVTDLAAEQKKWQGIASRIHDDVRTPLEKFGDKIEELQNAVTLGGLGWEDYQRAVAKAAEEVRSATGAAKELKAESRIQVGAATRGTSAGFSAVQSGRDQIQKLAELQRQQLAAQREANALTSQLIQITRDRAQIRQARI